MTLAAGALAAGGWWFAHSSFFDARHVRVSGRSHLSRTAIIEASGVGPSTNVLWANPSSIAAAVETNPWIASATVTRGLPSTISIRVTERRPASTVVVGSTWFLVASDGTVLGPAPHRPRLPVLPSSGTVTVGVRNPALAPTAAVAGGMSPWLRSRVVTVSPGPGGAVQLALTDGVHVLFGPATEVRAKNQAIAGILEWARERHTHLATIDVRSPVAPDAVRFDAATSSKASSGYSVQH